MAPARRLEIDGRHFALANSTTFTRLHSRFCQSLARAWRGCSLFPCAEREIPFPGPGDAFGPRSMGSPAWFDVPEPGGLRRRPGRSHGSLRLGVSLA